MALSMAERQRNRRKRLKQQNIREISVLAHVDDAERVINYARKLLKHREKSRNTSR